MWIVCCDDGTVLYTSENIMDAILVHTDNDGSVLQSNRPVTVEEQAQLSRFEVTYELLPLTVIETVGIDSQDRLRLCVSSLSSLITRMREELPFADVQPLLLQAQQILADLEALDRSHA